MKNIKISLTQIKKLLETYKYFGSVSKIVVSFSDLFDTGNLSLLIHITTVVSYFGNCNGISHANQQPVFDVDLGYNRLTAPFKYDFG